MKSVCSMFGMPGGMVHLQDQLLPWFRCLESVHHVHRLLVELFVPPETFPLLAVQEESPRLPRGSSRAGSFRDWRSRFGFPARGPRSRASGRIHAPHPDRQIPSPPAPPRLPQAVHPPTPLMTHSLPSPGVRSQDALVLPNVVHLLVAFCRRQDCASIRTKQLPLL